MLNSICKSDNTLLDNTCKLNINNSNNFPYYNLFNVCVIR